MFTYTTISNFLSKEECSNIIDISLNNLNLIPAKIGNGTNLGFDEDYRKSNIAFTQYNNSFPLLKDRIINTLSDIIKLKGYDLSFDSNFQFTEYQINGHYDWHTDSGGILSHRYCSLVIQLNDEYDGGELKIINDNKQITLERGVGNLFIFLSSLEHKVEKITKGTRYSLVNWFSLKPIDGFKKTLI
jgi:predicted 2-oxoglutarate/Fe(II)-dependent dioxygenase YbiX